MKKLWIVLALCLSLALPVLAAEAAAPLPLKEEDLIFPYGETEYPLLTDPADLIAAIAAHDGEEMTVEEAMALGREACKKCYP